jgi:lyso-ornithine lipid O-acyltransferase
MASRSIARADPLASLRGGTRLLLLAIACLSYVILHLLTRAAGRPSPWPRRFLARVARISGADVELHGTPLARDVLFVSNHTSWLDIPVMAAATGTAFVANSGVRRWPLVGWLASLNDTVYIDRGDRAGVHEQVAAVREALGRHQPIAIFPEGTTSIDLLPFKPSLLEVVSPPPRAIRVQPLRLDYSEAIELAWIGSEPAPRNAWRVLSRRGRFTVRLHCLEPFDPAAAGDRKAIAAEARARVLTGSAWHPPSV